MASIAALRFTGQIAPCVITRFKSESTIFELCESLCESRVASGGSLSNPRAKIIRPLVHTRYG